VKIEVAWPVIFGSAITTFLLLSAIVGFAWRARQRPALAGGEELIGLEGEVVEWQGEKGSVRVRSEVWAATSDRSLDRGARVRVMSRQGLVLSVRAL
jgi:membrane-bound serine protease (ClpP class)